MSYGRLIQEAREAAALTPDQLGERMGRTKGIVYRLEAEEQQPTVEQINVLVSTLRLSAEELLRAMGVNLTPPAAAKLPRPLIELLLLMTPQQHQALLDAFGPAMAQGRQA